MTSVFDKVRGSMKGRDVEDELGLGAITNQIPESRYKEDDVTEKVEKESLSFIDKNAQTLNKDENGNLKIHMDKEALDDFKTYESDLVLELGDKAEKILRYIDIGIYRNSMIKSYDLSAEDFREFVLELYSIYNDYDRGDTAFYSAAMFTNSYAMRMGRETLVRQYKFKNEELPTKEYIDGNIILEDKSDRAVIIAIYTSLGDKELAKRIVKGLARRDFHPSTPTYTNSGKTRSGEATSCYIFALEDNIDSIQYATSVALQKSKRGGGIGYDLSNLRARGETIKGVKNRAKGVIPVAKGIEWAVGYADQDGNRPGSAVANLSVFHPDIEDFLSSKKENAEESIRLKTLSTAIIVYDKFYELLEQGGDYYTFYPRTVFEEYGKNFTDLDFNEMYDELVANPRVRKKKFNARDIMSLVARLHAMRGYPYIIHYDNMNRQHVFEGIEEYKVKASNLCSEIFQLQVPGTYDVQCTLSAINISEVIKNDSLEETSYTVTQMLNNILLIPHEDETDYTVVNAKEDFRAIGVGVLDFHGFIANHGIAYESREALDFADAFFAMFNYYSIKSSNKEAKRIGKFKDFDKSSYADGRYFNQYVEKDFLPKTDKVRALFEEYGITLPTKEDWAKLRDEVKDTGLANAYRNCIQPTGSISYLSGTTPSVMPIQEKVERRSYKHFTANYPVPNLSSKNFFLYKEAHKINQFRYLDLISVMQKHIDQGISTTLFITDEITTNEWIQLALYAHHRGLKSLYYSKNKLIKTKVDFSNFEECIACT